MTSPLLRRSGAVEADAPDQGVAAHYGSPAHEQRALLAGEAITDLSHRDVIAIGGPDRLTWLHSLTTQHLESLPPGERTDVLLLSPQGRIEHGFSGVDDGEVFWAHTEPGAAPALVEFLDRMRFFSQVTVEVRTDQAVVGRIEDDQLVTDLVPRADLETIADASSPVAGLWAWEALRIATGLVRIGVDTDDRTIPNEVGLLGRAVHLDKGCYRGQETVARVHNLGRPPRRLVRLMLDGSVDRLPEPGSPVVLDGTTVGFLGSAARHHEWGPVGLALVKRSVDPAAVLQVDDVPAVQETVVDPDVGLHVRPTVPR